MNKSVKLICILIIGALLVLPVSAESATPYSSAFFCSYDSFIDMVGVTDFEVWFDVVSAGAMEELGVKSVKVQRSADGENWITAKTFSSDHYPQMICYDTCCVYDCVSYSAYADYYYRAYVTFYAKNSRGTGYMYQYSETIYIPPFS